MADEKTFTETEHTAILADRVATETAALTETVTSLQTEKSDLENKLDVAEAARVAAEQRAETAENALEEFKAEIEREREAAARKSERLEAVKEVAAHLGEDFFEDEDRISRIVAMADEDFTAYCSDLKATAPSPATPGVPVPRETAMRGAGADTPSQAGGATARAFLLGTRLPQTQES